jgi:hypothetical protein
VSWQVHVQHVDLRCPGGQLLALHLVQEPGAAEQRRHAGQCTSNCMTAAIT